MLPLDEELPLQGAGREGPVLFGFSGKVVVNNLTLLPVGYFELTSSNSWLELQCHTSILLKYSLPRFSLRIKLVTSFWLPPPGNEIRWLTGVRLYLSPNC